MTEPTTADPAASATAPAPEPAVARPAAPAEPAAPGAPRSRGWIGVVALLVAVALLAGMNAVLFVRVRKAQDRADQAVAATSAQDQIRADLDRIDASLQSVGTSQQDAASRLDTVSGQVSALRKCVNTALDAWAQATQSGKPATITKC